MTLIKSNNSNNLQIYTIAGKNHHKTIDSIIASKSSKLLRKEDDWDKRIELIQNFEFPTASSKIKISKDGLSIMATGVYKPQVRVYDLLEATQKFERFTTAENLLSDDWTKSVHLQVDRSLDFHDQGNLFHSIRIPKFGRSLAYNQKNSDLLIGGASNEVFRVNLEYGQFSSSLTTKLPEINAIDVNPLHQLYAFGGVNGIVEFWDPRNKSCITSLNTLEALNLADDPEITCLKYAHNGMNFSLGFRDGTVALFDLRSTNPTIVKEHPYGYSIKNITWADYSSNTQLKNKMISMDKKAIKIWDSITGENYASIESQLDFNDFAHYTDSGLILSANEGVPMHIFYIPFLGPSPKWASFLENITEEMEDNKDKTIYEDLKLVTEADLIDLKLDHLIGSDMIKAHMHGYLIDFKLYNKAKKETDPFSYEEYREMKFKEKIEAIKSTRIRGSAKVKISRVNQKLVERLVNQPGKSKLLYDDRFQKLFEDKEFELIDDKNPNLRKRKPGQTARKLKREYGSDSDDLLN